MSLPLLPINEARLWQRLMMLAANGKYGRTGVNRQALTEGDLAAKQWLLAWATERGFEASADPIGNLFIRRPGLTPAAAPVVVGSHLDTEPTGGRFDGAYGVVAAMELLDALAEARIATHHPVDLVVWANEEGCRFLPGCMGSKTYTDPGLLPAMLRSCDIQGIPVAMALMRHQKELAGLSARSLGQPLAAFLEVHIEQGPVLEQIDRPIAAVSGIQGRRVYDIVFPGATGHAGTVPQALRKDALQRALPFLQSLYARAAAERDIRVTPGRLIIEPNSPSVIPGGVTLTVDIRHPKADTLDTIPAWLSALAADRHPGEPVSLKEIDRTDPAIFDVTLTAIAAQACREIAADAPTLTSGASHDAHPLASFCPTTMVFARCRGGVSHHEDEYASSSDLALGAQALSACLLAAAKIQPPFGTRI